MADIIDYDKELPDHLGKIRRLEAVVAHENTMEIVIQRVIDGESLRQIAKTWQLPVTRFVKWVSEDAKRLNDYEAALRIRADELAHEALEAAEGSEPMVTKDDDGNETTLLDNPVAISRDKLKVDAKLKIAAMWDRQKYGNEKSEGGAGITVIVNRESAISAPNDQTVVIDG